MTRILANVTHENITNGIRGDETSCPIALALLDRGLGLVEVNYGNWEAYDPESGNYMYGRLSANAKRFVALYDQGDVVEPQRFYLEAY